ncbi:NAD(P)/FAD-dependent oxidoreductase [Kangiella marina]|uniref:FAD-dependent oxidoreductase n=1 Tax=Kangiella marina TaxID=1079178 RepID=A0ABP8II95_9GAMM
MKVAVIGSGISGISAAEYLCDSCEVTVFEKDTRVGGHADTQTIDVGGQLIDVDTGFIVFNPDNYPRFYQLLKKYQVDYQDSDMSFAVSNRFSGLEYNATNLNKLFCQRKNLLNPKFYRMIRDIQRFYKEARALLDDNAAEIPLGDYLRQNGYSEYFIDEHIIPMASALWSGKADLIMDFPARYLVAFMQNHNMMQINDRPVWKTITGGSKRYLSAITEKANFDVRLNSSIQKVVRTEDTVTLTMAGGEEEHFDNVIFACHSDQALSLVEKPTADEERILGAIKYQKNDICLHWDEALLPKRKAAWASWNVIRNEASKEQCTVSYCMNLLQSLPTKQPVVVSLNMNELVDKSKVWKYLEYDHPIYTIETISAQKERSKLQGQKSTYYCGAYWGWGFHEDGARSGLEAAQQLLSDNGYAEK